MTRIQTYSASTILRVSVRAASSRLDIDYPFHPYRCTAKQTGHHDFSSAAETGEGHSQEGGQG